MYAALEARLSRSGAKETVLDYAPAFAARRGLAERLGLGRGIALGTESVAETAEPARLSYRDLITELRGGPTSPSVKPLASVASVARTRTHQPEAPRSPRFAGLRLRAAASVPRPPEPERLEPARSHARSSCAGSRCGSWAAWVSVGRGHEDIMRDGRHHDGRSGSVADVAPDPDVREAGDAAAAFDALRAQVETLFGQLTTIGRGVGAVLDQLEAQGAPVGYRTDLGRLVQGLEAVSDRLLAVERAPALRQDAGKMVEQLTAQRLILDRIDSLIDTRSARARERWRRHAWLGAPARRRSWWGWR